MRMVILKWEYGTEDESSSEVAAIMEYRGVSLAQAVDEVIEMRLEKGTRGLVAVSRILQESIDQLMKWSF